MYFFLESHQHFEDRYEPTSFRIVKCKNLNHVKEYIIKYMNSKLSKSITYYKDGHYHCYEYEDNEGKKILRFGKLTKDEIDPELDIEEIN